MEWYAALALLLGIVCTLMGVGVPVAIAFLFANIVGAVVFLGYPNGLISVIRGSMASISNFTLAPIPLFLMVGEILLQSGLAFKAVGAIDRLIARVPGRLAVVAVTGGTAFSALSGSTIATTAMLGNALLPQMLQRKYHPAMAVGPILAIGGVDILIPPSALAVLLGSLAKIPIAELLIGGVLPGLLMSLFFFVYIVVRCRLNPALAPGYEVERWSARERWLPFLQYVVPLFAIFLAVIGGIFSGIASPTDSAALGAMATVVIALAYRALTWKILLSCLLEVAKCTTMILFIVAASLTFSQILAFSGATDGALRLLGGLQLTPLTAILMMIAVLLVLGFFLDEISMMLLTLPFFMPLALALKLDLVHLGVIFLIAMQLGLLMPPFGLLLFVMKAVAPPQIRMSDIYTSVLPFLLLTLTVLCIVVAWPPIATLLPRVFL